MARIRWAAACLLASVSLSSLALDIGFEGYASVIGSDNVGADNSPDEEEGLIGFATAGVYGEQRSRIVQGAFSGELDTRRRLDDEDDTDFVTISRFLGAAEFALTPQAFRWYVGDILGGVRVDNGIQPIDDAADSVQRRNVFVTGPTVELDIDSETRLDARLLYVNQTEDDRELETLYNASIDWQRETTRDSYFGFAASDIYTDNLADEDSAAEPDFNRVSVAGYINRVRGFNAVYAQLGGTRYDTDADSLNGVNAALRGTRILGPTSSVSLSLSRDLSDQTLNTVESIIDDGTGVQPEADGFFDETRLELSYALESVRTNADFGIGVTQRDYRLVGSSDPELAVASADELQNYAYAIYGRPLTVRLRGEFSVRFEKNDYDVRDDSINSVLGEARLVYSLSRSFELEAGYVFDRAEGQRSTLIDGVLTDEPVDITENRATLGIRWAPPSRASRELTIELKSLLR